MQLVRPGAWRWFVVAIAATASGCERPAGPINRGNLVLETVAGADTQTVLVGTQVPVQPVVRVVDGAGQPVEGVHVIFGPTLGESSNFYGTIVSNVEGLVSLTNWTAGTKAGLQGLTAVIAQNSLTSTAAFYLMATPGPAVSATLTLDSVAVAVGATSVALVHTLLDEFGNAIGPSTNPTYASEDSSIATVTANQVTGVANGRASIVVTDGQYTNRVLVVVGGHVRTVTSRPQAYSRSVAISADNVGYVATYVGHINLLHRVDPVTEEVASLAMLDPYLNDVVFHPNGAVAYVSVGGHNFLYVVDVATNAVIDSISVPHPPWHLAVTPDGEYILGAIGDFIFRVHTTTFAVGWIQLVGGGRGLINDIIAHPTMDWFLVTMPAGWVSVYNLETFALQVEIQNSGNPTGLAITPDGAHLFITNETRPLEVRNGLTLALEGATSGIVGATEVSVAPNGKQVYVATPSALHVLPASGLLVLESVPLAGGIRVAASPVGRMALVTGANTIFFVR